MATEDAINYLISKRDLLCLDCKWKDKKCNGCKEKEAYNLAIDAVKADTKKKPIAEESGFLCPNCDTEIGGEQRFDYCPSCGQALDWEKE